jgi:uncharacterized protein
VLPCLRSRLVGVTWASGFLLQIVIMIVLTVVSLPLTHVKYQGLDTVLNFGTFLPFLLLALVGFLFQTGFEEAYFRGFIEQLIRRTITKSVPWIIGLAAVSFASKHIGNIQAYGGKWIVMLPYLLFALTMGWTAWRTGSLMLSIGLHWGNNLSIALLIKTTGDVIPSMAPFVRETPTLTAATLFAIGQAILTIAFVEWIVRRRAKDIIITPATEQPA